MNRGILVSESDEHVFEEHGYTFIHLLGEGTYAKVWLVSYCRIYENKKKDFLLACKVIDTENSPRDFIKKFIPREIDILSKIKHPHLIHLHSIYQRKMRIFIFMRYAERGDLLEYVLMNGEIKENKARLWTHQLSLGLQYLHNHHIVHRDIKCENVLITKNNNVKLADFGFSRFIIDSSGRRSLSSTYCGSIAYAAPEVIKGKPYDPKCSDIWSLGVVLYVMVNQCMPFNDTNLKKLYELQMNSEWSFRSRVAPGLSKDIKILIHGMLQPDTATRFSVDDVVNSRWLLADKRFNPMLQKKREDIESGLRTKIGMLPKSQKFSILYSENSKKDEQAICMASLRLEQSSDQFNLDISTSKTGSTNLTEVAESRTKIKIKDDVEEVNKTSITTERLESASPTISKQTKKQSSSIQKLGETEVDDTSKKHFISGIGKRKESSTGINQLGSNLSRTEKYTSVLETEESQKQSTTIRTQTSSDILKPSNVALDTDKTSSDIPTSSNIVLSTDQISSQEETEKEITNPNQPVSEEKN